MMPRSDTTGSAVPRSAETGWPFKSVLVTGGSGYLAASLIRRLAEETSTVRNLRRRPRRGPRAAVASGFEEVIGDVRDAALWDRILEGVDLVLHLAAQTSVSVAEADPLGDHEVNVLSMLRLLEACRRTSRCPAVLFAGTATQVGVTRTVPVGDAARDEPVTVYDLHKTVAEDYLGYYVRQGHVRGATLRLPNIYGPGPESSSADRGVLNVMIRKALEGETLTIFGSGRHLRDYLYVDDAAGAFVSAAARVDALAGGHFVVGTGEGTTIAQAVERVAERVRLKTGRAVEVAHVDPPAPLSPIEQRDFVADSRKFRAATGWRPSVPLVEGIDRTIAALLDGKGKRP